MATSGHHTGKTALITGATSGIGAAFARRFASQGYDLIITGRRQEKIRALADEISATHGVSVEVTIADFSHPDEVESLARKVKGSLNLAILVNNAGYGSAKGGFLSYDPDEHIDMIRTHVIAPVLLTHAALPGMLSRSAGIIINVSSVAAWLVFPGSHTYAPTKSYLHLFTEALHMELEGTGVKVQSLCPGFTKTDFHRRIGWDPSRLESRGVVRWMEADRVVDCSLSCLRKNRVVCIPGFWNRVIVHVVSLIPRGLYYLLAISEREKRSQRDR